MSKPMGSRGFTLIEIMAAFVVVMLTSLATVSVMTSTTRFLNLNEDHSDAVREAQEVLEDLRAVSYPNIASGSRTSEDGRYKSTWTVEENPTLTSGGGSEDGLKLITVTVTWKWHGKAQHFQMSTVYAEINGKPTA